MTQPLPEPVSVILCEEEEAGRIVVDLDAFARFTAQIEASLAEFEARWSHLTRRWHGRATHISDQAPGV